MKSSYRANLESCIVLTRISAISVKYEFDGVVEKPLFMLVETRLGGAVEDGSGRGQKRRPFQLWFNSSLRVDFPGTRVTSDRLDEPNDAPPNTMQLNRAHSL